VTKREVEKDLKEVEEKIKQMFENNVTGTFIEEEIMKVKSLEGIKIKLLEKEEALRGLKSRAI